MESLHGKGSMFYFSAPFIRVEDQSIEADTSPEFASDASGMTPDRLGGLRILVAEDNRMNQQVNNADLGHRLAHTLKSSAGSIGATRLEKAALSVEPACRNGGRPHEELINELEAAHSEAMEGIEAYIGHDS